MRCIIRYPVSDEQHQTETIEFKELDKSMENANKDNQSEFMRVN